MRSSQYNGMQRAHRGQTLIMALAILFVLLFLGGIFVVQIARNLEAASRSKTTTNSQSFSEAGINYCANQLTYSEEGADWRPAPTQPFTSATDPSGVTDPDYRWLSQGFARVFFNGGRALVRVVYEPRADDPRSQYLRIEAVGRPGDISQGDVDPTIFVQQGSLPPQLRREQVAYVALGLTDYLFFVTNKDRSSYENFIGTPHMEASQEGVGPLNGLHDPLSSLGDPTIAAHATSGVNNNEVLYGAPMYLNGPVRFGGDTYFFLSPRLSYPAAAETIFTSSTISLAPTRLTNTGPCPGSPTELDDNDAQVFVNVGPGTVTPPIAQAVEPSGCKAFSTMLGLVRDGAAVPDNVGFTRGIPRLEPMLMDTKVDGSGVLRYRALTRDSGFFVNNLNTGFFGWGRGIYINNPQDLQHESQGANGGYSLRADWLDPKAFPNSYWDGPNYRPPGVQLEIRGTHLIFTRSDGDVFRKPDGTPITANGGRVIDIPLADDERKNYVFPDGTAYVLPPLSHLGDEATSVAGNPPGYANPFKDQNSYGVNLVIMLEGNVRIKGVYGGVTDPTDTTVPHLGRVHLSIVTGGTAYIEGSLVKGDGYVTAGVPTLERGSTCSIMAKDYVCVNTTMFMSPQNQTGVWTPDPSTDGVFDVYLGTTRQSYDVSFPWGVDPVSYQTGGAASPIFLMTRQRALSPGPTAMNLFINPAVNLNGSSVYQFLQDPLLPPESDVLGTKFVGGISVPVANEITPGADMRALLLRAPLSGTPPYYDATTQLFNTILRAPGFDNVLRFQKDQNASNLLGAGGTTDYLFGGAMVAPLDVRIEAAMYAQEKSFFVIPGYSINPDPNDTRINFAKTGIRPSYSIGSSGQLLDTAADKAEKDVYPFYGEPTDVRITIFGAISENYTASMGDQAAWMAKWGYIPGNYGSSGTVIPDDHLQVHDATGVLCTYNPGEDRATDFRTPLEVRENITHSLRYLYDPAFAMPYQHATDVNLTTGATSLTRAARALRSKFTAPTAWWPNGIYQILPPTPRQPVCPGLLYFGDSDHPLVP